MGLLVRIWRKAESGNQDNGILSWFLLYENQDKHDYPDYYVTYNQEKSEKQTGYGVVRQLSAY